MSENKTFKCYCKEAKKRLKEGYWERYQKELKESIMFAEEKGISQTKIKEYYTQKAQSYIKPDDGEEEFYNNVKKIISTEGEVSDVIGRLTDKKVFEQLSYDEKQRYIMTLSERYLKAVERYKKEMEIVK